MIFQCSQDRRWGGKGCENSSLCGKASVVVLLALISRPFALLLHRLISDGLAVPVFSANLAVPCSEAFS